MNDKIYPKLSADERFKMVIKTFVNGDEVQREKLVKSCPRFTYLQSDHSYVDRIEASRDIVTTFIIQLLEYDKIISILETLRVIDYDINVQKAERENLREINSFLLAFEKFCLEYLGVESEDMIRAWYGFDERYIKRIGKFKELINIYQVDYDPEINRIWLMKVFLPVWEKRVEQ
ncbi:hypothetical protein [Bacillus altitudinis]|uniref:hypothetical protein n=1 Tax=Bacillus altitudinis TaxID=293387 RepID=UPI003CF8D559